MFLPPVNNPRAYLESTFITRKQKSTTPQNETKSSNTEKK
jgi:hypothetical protein